MSCPKTSPNFEHHDSHGAGACTIPSIVWKAEKDRLEPVTVAVVVVETVIYSDLRPCAGQPETVSDGNCKRNSNQELGAVKGSCLCVNHKMKAFWTGLLEIQARAMREPRTTTLPHVLLPVSRPYI